MESVVEKNFFEYLLGLGFPTASVIYEPTFQPIGQGRRYRPDFALIDPATKEPLAIIEIKGSNNSDTLVRAMEQIRLYLDALRDKAVRGYVVTPAKSGGGFDFYTLGDDGNPKQVPPTVLRFESLSTARLAEKKELLSEEKKDTTDRFLIVCFCASAFSVVIALVDFVCSRNGITLLTAERMALLSVAIALLIVPYVQKFKGLGIEIDRAAKQVKG